MILRDSLSILLNLHEIELLLKKIESSIKQDGQKEKDKKERAENIRPSRN